MTGTGPQIIGPPLRAGRPALTQTALFVAMELSWIAALALFWDAAITGKQAPAFALLIALYPLAMLASGPISRRARERWPALAAHGALCFALIGVTSALALPDRWVAGGGPGWLPQGQAGQSLLVFAALGAMCWVRGAMVAASKMTASTVAIGFQIGLAALLAVMSLSAGLGVVWTGAVALPTMFLVSALLALWYVRAGTLNGDHAVEARRNPAAALLGVGLVVGFGLVVAAVLDRALLERARALVTWLGEQIGALIAYLVGLLPEVTPQGREAPSAPEPFAGPPVPDLSDVVAREPNTIMIVLFSILIAGIVVMAIVAILPGLLAWLRQRRRPSAVLDYDRSSHGLRDTLRALWWAIVAGVSRWSRRLAGRLRPAGAPEPGEQLRRAYKRMGRILSVRGWPRHAFETPFAYADRLRPEWPGRAGDLDIMTRLYVRERYGQPVAISPQRLARFEKKLRRSSKKVRSRNAHAQPTGPSGAPRPAPPAQ